tara:strand:- start:664 stop:915 length:252 start_codon:yes stop_codon:yes gene_type:complete
MIEAFGEFFSIGYVVFVLFVLLFLSQMLFLYLGEPSEQNDSFEGRLTDAFTFALRHTLAMGFISLIAGIIIGVIYFVFSSFVS